MTAAIAIESGKLVIVTFAVLCSTLLYTDAR